MKKIIFFLIFIFTLFLIIAELFNVYFSVKYSVIIILVSIVYFIKLFRKKRIGIVSLLFFLVFTLPFLHLIPYLWTDLTVRTDRVWGLVANPFQFNNDIMNLVGMMSTCGMMGMILPTLFIRKKNLHGVISDKSKIVRKSMPLVLWFIWLVIGLILSIISAPQESVLDAAYTSVGSVSRELNVNSAWLLSYVILLFALYDSLVEKNNYVRKIKKISIFSVIAYIVIILQFFRGDRESIPWLLACVLMIYYWLPFSTNTNFKIPKAKLTIFVTLAFVISVIVGAGRGKISDAGNLSNAASITTNIIKENPELLKGTWTAVLLTPLSSAGDFLTNNKSYLWGEDYLNLILSIPPGFIADMIGYERPWGSGKGPAKEMIYGQGGTHSSVLPFRNFGLLGIIFITSIIFNLVIKLDDVTYRKPSMSSTILLSTIVTILPHWLWYGEKNLLNGLIMFYILLFFYKVSLSFKNITK